MSDRLVEILREKSVRWGAFTLASGRASDLYVDARQTTLHAEGGWLVGRRMLDRLRPDVVGIGGMTLGADPIASATAIKGPSACCGSCACLAGSGSKASR